MRNLVVWSAAVAGAWYVAHAVMQLSAQGVSASLNGANPISALLLLPATLGGALAAGFVASFLLPRGW
jgi:hypothetical protein